MILAKPLLSIVLIDKCFERERERERERNELKIN